MISLDKLPAPLSSIVIENIKGSYKDFELNDPSDYPIPGVNFFADYGYIPGYIGEDGHDLDVFVGDDLNGLCGYFTVWRSDDVPEEHKFFVAMTGEQLEKTLAEYKPVFVAKTTLGGAEDVVSSIERFREES